MKMNINELVKAFNIEAAMTGVVARTGTFKEILDSVYSRKLDILTNNNNDIIGIELKTGLPGREDSIEKLKFKKRYLGTPCMTWVCKALELYYNRYNIDKVIEDGFDVKVVTSDGEVIKISRDYDKHFDADDCEDCDGCDDCGNCDECKGCEYNKGQTLPTSITADPAAFDDLKLKTVRKYLNITYGYCLAKGTRPTITLTKDGDVEISDIKWGRKLSANEYDRLDD